ncbi:uncharacterized protein BP5553_00834 [Venustampulla echinocandica]|uniref:Rieske domain-containing protein n=1 Tax=Venustampulla echinocandica TaxID=2656787 RepID=A0A370TZB6_9HELO|nr:uncharacterized protein BP5553_00834 [Venustampulla echinocandica]RDL40855.1 hypothetical protein BP5553_00834 [Venustampulla echinocandica]
MGGGKIGTCSSSNGAQYSTWHFMTHASRFKKPGDYRTFELAGFSIILILGKDKQLRAFQNICRHRAYQVTKKECGSSTVLGCRYHGWSYDTTGRLIKAPEFESIAGFDKNMNGLWPIKLEVKDSMVFMNLDSSSQILDLELNESEQAFKRWDSKHVHCAVEWKVDCEFNWKLAAEDFSQLLAKENTRGLFNSLMAQRFKYQRRDFNLGHTATTRRLAFGTLLTMRLLPQSAAITTIHCSIYKNQPINDKVELEFESVKAEIQRGVQHLEQTQKRLLNGYGNFSKLQQEKYRQILKGHRDAEARLGQEIHPAAQKQHLTMGGKADDEFCRKLDNTLDGEGTACSASHRGLLDW